MKVSNDKFYTNEDVAKHCISLIENISSFDVVIEPSAGNGSFSNNIKNCLAFDIEPEDEKIIRQDFFTVKKQDGKVLVIGNPPFGVRNNLSQAFIKHSINIGTNTIAFVLPNVYNKIILQKIFPDNWKLIKVEALEENSFFVGTVIYHVPCSFFIWTKEESSINLRKQKLEQPKEFSFLKRGSTEADFCINGNNGKTKKVSEVSNTKAEHYIKTDLPRCFFDSLKYEFNSSANGGVSWIGQQEIIDAFLKAKKM